MESPIRYLRYPMLLVFLSALAACSDKSSSVSRNVSHPTLDVYTSRTCECCELWVQHMEGAGFHTKLHHPTDLNQFKNDHGIDSGLQSCHTAISKEGYVFEGHIPARYTQQFLDHPPAGARGLSVPGMPAGSPGMEVGNQFTPYKIWVLKKDGSAEIFAGVDSPDQQ